MGGAVPHHQNPITLQTLCAFQAERNFKNGEFAYRNSHNYRLQTKRSLMNKIEIINPDAKSNCFLRFRRMRIRRERLDIFINTKEGEEVGAYHILLFCLGGYNYSLELNSDPKVSLLETDPYSLL
ncbi:unnamed protein product [Hymenolepis diminuta]|uniref:Uncharacterized protein n=1 Tax=Hymenolepis diminuta TaxID=6216 RepID=A0A564YMC3_HYMDI|nr:unnamed protein product [Hymenolepis diminuta]